MLGWHDHYDQSFPLCSICSEWSFTPSKPRSKHRQCSPRLRGSCRWCNGCTSISFPWSAWMSAAWPSCTTQVRVLFACSLCAVCVFFVYASFISIHGQHGQQHCWATKCWQLHFWPILVFGNYLTNVNIHWTMLFFSLLLPVLSGSLDMVKYLYLNLQAKHPLVVDGHDNNGTCTLYCTCWLHSWCNFQDRS